MWGLTKVTPDDIIVLSKEREEDNMPYMICNNDNYLHRNKKNHFSVVHTMENATTWSDAQKADNVCTINAKELVQKYGLEVKYVSQENKVVNPPAKPIELDYDILDKERNFTVFFLTFFNEILEIIFNTWNVIVPAELGGVYNGIVFASFPVIVSAFTAQPYMGIVYHHFIYENNIFRGYYVRKFDIFDGTSSDKA